jgi:hypothetical protein
VILWTIVDRLTIIHIAEGMILRWMILFLFALCGCTSIGDDKRGISRIFVGVVRVKLPQHGDGLSAIDVKALGLGWDGGPWLGWRNGNWVVADPSRCQLLVIIRTPVQADNAIRILSSLGEQPICVADFTNRLRH